jgi:hypothetical protein
MPRAGFKTAIPSIKRPQTYALDCAANGIGLVNTYYYIHLSSFPIFLTLCSCFAFKTYIGISKFPIRALFLNKSKRSPFRLHQACQIRRPLRSFIRPDTVLYSYTMCGHKRLKELKVSHALHR